MGKINLIQRIKKKNIIHPGDCVVVGLSGGPDSVCLLHALSELRESMSLTLYAAHLNHNLRGMEANRDASFAMNFSKDLGVHCIVKSEEVELVAQKEKLSIEAAGRLCRYHFLEEVADRLGASKIAVAHHLNDQAETLLMHLLRGSGLTGLAGMVPMRNRLIRPLLDVNREEIMAYCKDAGLDYRTDATNEEPVVLRNRIRLELLPLLEAYNPNVVQALGRTALLLGRDEETLNDLANEKVMDSKRNMAPGCYELAVLKELPEALLSRAIRIIWRQCTNTSHTLLSGHVESVMHGIKSADREREYHLPGGVHVQVMEEGLFCGTDSNVLVSMPVMPPMILRQPGITWLPQGRGWLQVKRIPAQHPVHLENLPHKKMIAADGLWDDLVIRPRRQGEHWRPLGMKGTKSIKKTLMEMKVPREMRDQQLLLCHGDQVIWVLGHGISETVRITPKTQEILVIEYHETDQ